MSYLLTEIALEMLGYKYYDISGVCGPTDFQSLGQYNTIQPTTNKPAEEREELLEDILNLSGHLTGNQTSADETADVSVKSSAPDESASAEASISKLRTNKVNQDTFNLSTRNVVDKLLDKEYEKIKSELYQNKAQFLQSNEELIKQTHVTPADILEPFTNQEKENIKAEVQTMECFRKTVEQTLYKINPQLFDKYKKQFNEK